MTSTLNRPTVGQAGQQLTLVEEYISVLVARVRESALNGKKRKSANQPKQRQPKMQKLKLPKPKPKQLVFFGNAGIGTRGGWEAKAVLQACRKVVERPNSGRPTNRLPGKVVTVDEFSISRVSSATNSPQPCEAGLDRSKPTRPGGWKAGQLHQDTPGDLGKWVDRDCNAALNLQRAGESKWRPLELCRWQHQGAAPAKGKEYPALGFKKLRDRAPKAQAQQPVAQ
ncbi:hypothetical protein QJQ45_000921 [Haematococcus lacustris]|nr:hypothetical protein QJQ45_000921 [Haematococcus lacustris]